METDDRKERIIEAARDLFARFGLRKTSVQEIARASHMAKGSLYYYFRSKAEVFEAVVQEELDRLWDVTREAVEAAKDPERKISEFVLTRMRELKRLANAYATLHDEYLEHLGFVEKIRGRTLQREIDMIAGILKEGIASGAFRRLDVGVTAQAIVVALKGLEFPWATRTNDEEVKQHLNALIGILFDGIRAR